VCTDGNSWCWLVYEEEAHRHGHATWARYFPSAQISSVAGDYVVWHEQNVGYLQWQCLPGTGKTGQQFSESKVLDLSSLIEPAKSILVSSLHVNENRFLHLRLLVQDSLYCSQKAANEYSARYVSP
jgi:hypothetical protein